MKLSSLRLPVFALATLASALLLNLVVPATSSLAAYSETRSFRDALDGRSMEEALSGPVDKDTSSYGGPSSGATASGNDGGSNQLVMALDIGANGDPNGKQASEQEQQKPSNGDSAGGELEREAGPTSGIEQQYKGQMARLVNGVRGRNGRSSSMQTNGANQRMDSGRLAQAAEQTPEQQQRPTGYDAQMAGSKSNSGESASTGGFGEGDSGDKGIQLQRYGNGADSAPRFAKVPAGNSEGSYGGTRSSGMEFSQQSGGAEQQQRQQGGSTEQESLANGGAERPASYGAVSPDNGEQQQMQQAEQLMAAMMQTGKSGRLQQGSYGNGGNGIQMSRVKQVLALEAIQKMLNGKQQQLQKSDTMSVVSEPSSMAQSMMMSLANKAAYASGKQIARSMMNGRQMAPPMMVHGTGQGIQQQQKQLDTGTISTTTESLMANSYGVPSPFPVAQSGIIGGANGVPNGRPMMSRGGMRRANQRKLEKKMSPAMVNAMLNKMLGKQTALDGMDYQAQDNGSRSAPMVNALNGFQMRPQVMTGALMSQMMKTPAGQEALADMMMANGAGAYGNGNSGEQMMSMGMQNSQSRESYKKMLMSAMMLQQKQRQSANEQQETQNSDHHSPQMGSNYGDRQQPAPMSKSMMMKATGGQGSYGSSAVATANGQLETMQSPMMPASYGTDSNGNTQRQMQMQAQQDSYAQNGGRKLRNESEMQQQEQSYENQQPVVGSQTSEKNDSPVKSPVETADGATSRAYGRANGSIMRPTMSYGNRAAPMKQPSPPPMSPAAMAALMRTMMAKPEDNSNNGYGASQMAAIPEQLVKQQVIARAMSMMMAENGKGKMSNDNGRRAYGQQQISLPAAGRQQQQPISGRQAYGEQDSKQSLETESTGSSSKGYDASQVGGEQPQLSEGTKSAENMASSKNPGAQMGGSNNGAPKGSYGNEDGDQQQQQQDEQQRQSEYGSAPMGQAEPFAFNYNIDDNYGNQQYRKEESDKNGVVRGSYGYMDMSGIYRHVEYVADENGFRANIKSNEPGLNGGQPTGAGAGANEASGSVQQQQEPMGVSGAGQQSSAAAAAPPSTSSSLGGSGNSNSMAPLMMMLMAQQQQQQDTQLPMTPLMDMRQQTAGGDQEEQRGQSGYSSGNNMQQQQATTGKDNGEK